MRGRILLAVPAFTMRIARRVWMLVRPAKITLPQELQSDTCNLAGKVILITGSTRGIGRASAIYFAEQGANVAVHGREAEHAEEVASVIRAVGGVARSFGANLALDGEATRLVNRIIAEFGTLDILVNNSAILPQHKRAAWEGDTGEFRNVLAINVAAPFEASMAAVRWWASVNRQGRIVNISSSVADTSCPPAFGLTAYGVSKIAL